MIEMEDVLIYRDGFRLHVPFLRLNRGLTLLVGKNGSGKTSLLELLATARQPDHGKIRYGGKSMLTDLPLIRKNLGFVPSGLELYEEMTPRQFLKYFAELKGPLPDREVDQVLHLLELEADSRRKIKTLSLGIQKRVAIAQALLGSPVFLFLDEPLNGLDGLERRRVIRLFSGYARDACVLVATHELNEWVYGMDAILWLDRGLIRFHDSPENWVHGLPQKVWKGTLDRSEYENSAGNNVAAVRKLDEIRVAVRIYAEEQPYPGFKRVPASPEDAYLIRRRILDQRRKGVP